MACHVAGFMPRVAQQAAQLTAVLSLVRSGLGVALVPARAADSIPVGVTLLKLARRVPIETGVGLPRHDASLPARNFAEMAIASGYQSPPK